MKATSRPRTAYHRLVRSFDHSDLAALPGYPALRQALGDIASQVPDTAFAAFAAAVRDMAVTAPFADLCGTCSDQCARDHPAGRDGGPCQCGDSCYWPHAAARADDWITGSYRCRQGHTWTCGYPISIAGGRLQAERTAPVCRSAATTRSSPSDSRPSAS
jgi:hypothetical protein